MDTTIDDPTDMGGPEEHTDETLGNADFPIPLDTLSIDGTTPEVGDQVSFKVGGKVTRIVNGDGYVKPETVNDQPLPKPPIQPNPAVDERTRLMALSKQSDDSGMGMDY